MSTRQQGRGRLIALAMAALLVAGALVHWREDIEQLLESGNPFLLAGLALVVPYLVLFAVTIRRASRARLDDDSVLRAQVNSTLRLRWVGIALCALIALGVAQPLFEDKWNQAELDAFVSAQQQEKVIEQEILDTGDDELVQRYREERNGAEMDYFSWKYGVGLPDVAAMIVNAIALSGMVFIAGVYLSLWVLGVLEIIISSFALSSPTPSWDPEQEKPLPADVVAKALDAQVLAAFSAILPAWQPGPTESDRLVAVVSLAQSVATFHLAAGFALFVVWLIWSALAIVGVVFGVVD